MKAGTEHPDTQMGHLLGVSYDNKRSRWKARIHFGGAVRYIGRFKTSAEAGLAYDQAARAINSLNEASAAPTDAANSKKRSRQLNFPALNANNPTVTRRLRAMVAEAQPELSHTLEAISGLPPEPTAAGLVAAIAAACAPQVQADQSLASTPSTGIEAASLQHQLPQPHQVAGPAAAVDGLDEWDSLLAFIEDDGLRLPLESLPKPSASPLQQCGSAEVRGSSDSSSAALGHTRAPAAAAQAFLGAPQLLAPQQCFQHQEEPGWWSTEAYTGTAGTFTYTAATPQQQKPDLRTDSNSSSTTTLINPAVVADVAGAVAAPAPGVGARDSSFSVTLYGVDCPAHSLQLQPHQHQTAVTSAALQPPRLLPLEICCSIQPQQFAGGMAPLQLWPTPSVQLPVSSVDEVSAPLSAAGQGAAWGMSAADAAASASAGVSEGAAGGAATAAASGGAHALAPAPAAGMFDCIQTRAQSMAVIGACLHALTDLELHLLQQPRTVSAAGAMLDWLHAAWHREAAARGAMMAIAAGPAAIAAAVAEAKSAPPSAIEPVHMSLLVLDKVMLLAADMLAGCVADVGVQRGFLLEVLVQLQQGLVDAQNVCRAQDHAGCCRDIVHAHLTTKAAACNDATVAAVLTRFAALL